MATAVPIRKSLLKHDLSSTPLPSSSITVQRFFTPGSFRYMPRDGDDPASSLAEKGPFSSLDADRTGVPPSPAMERNGGFTRIKSIGRGNVFQPLSEVFSSWRET